MNGVITPSPGSEITLLHDSTERIIQVRYAGPRLDDARVFHWYGYDDSGRFVHGKELLSTEGTMWVRGWNTSAAQAFRAQIALLRE